MSEPLANELQLSKYVNDLVDDYFDQMKDGASEDDISERINEDSDSSEHVVYYYKAKALVDMQWEWNTAELDAAEEELGIDLRQIYSDLARVILRLKLEERFHNRLNEEAML
jgi:hypothetical protein